jgi:hypothetical protein
MKPVEFVPRKVGLVIEGMGLIGYVVCIYIKTPQRNPFLQLIYVNKNGKKRKKKEWC